VTGGPLEVKVTHRDFRGRAWRLQYRATGGLTRNGPVIRGRGRGGFRTTTVTISDPSFDDGLPGRTDFALRTLRGDLEASFVRVVPR
jgi:hypothetical protein